MKLFKVEVTTTDNKKHLEFSSGEDELQAIDKVAKHYKNNILDIKVIN